MQTRRRGGPPRMASALRRKVEPRHHRQMQVQASRQRRDGEKTRREQELVERVIDVRSELLVCVVL
jgi:hypothetical protein